MKIYDIYNEQVKKFKLITDGEECILAEKIKKGDKKALNKLVCANLRIVQSVAENYKTTGVPIEDLVSAGNIGLITAAKKFNKDKNFKFISYAIWWIRREVINCIAKQLRIVDVPEHINRKFYAINKFIDNYKTKNRCLPSVLEISEGVRITLQQAEAAIKIKNRHISFDTPTQGGIVADFFGNAGFEKDVENKLGLENLIRTINELEERKSGILKDYYGLETGEPSTIKIVGDKYSLSGERVRQIIKVAEREIRGKINIARIKEQYREGN